jgi:DNA integrity scanning protein DisA with diadenylate cyclase activity
MHAKSRQYWGIGLTLLIVCTICMQSLALLWMQNQCKNRILSSDTKDLLTITIASTINYAHKEIIIKGQYFDIIKKEISGNNLLLTVVPDYLESSIISQFLNNLDPNSKTKFFNLFDRCIDFFDKYFVKSIVLSFQTIYKSLIDNVFHYTFHYHFLNVHSLFRPPVF